MTIEEMQTRKKELGYTNQQLADLTGVPLGTLQKIFSGATKAPRFDTIQALEKVLRRAPEDSSLFYGANPPTFAHNLPTSAHNLPTFAHNLPTSAHNLPTSAHNLPTSAHNLPTSECSTSSPDDDVHSVTYNVHNEMSAVHETALNYRVRKPGEYTLEDYLLLPEDVRVELIDGVFYDMAAPHAGHQSIAGFIFKLLLDHILEHGGKCMPLMSPADVQLDQDDKTVVQPDVMIICDRSKFRNGRVFGAPDFLVEVMSPSTKKRDMTLKLWKYSNAGVREYWIVDPVKRITMVYDLEHEEMPIIYDADAKVPVGIWGGECMIDFKKIYDLAGFLYEQ